MVFPRLVLPLNIPDHVLLSHFPPIAPVAGWRGEPAQKVKDHELEIRKKLLETAMR